MTTEPRVFDDTNRSDPSPASHSESGAGFLNRVAGPYWDQVRHLVEAWAARLPPAARTDVVARLRSSSDRQSSAAFWELYLHQSFVVAGFTVDVHPKVPTGSRPPDFLLSRGSESFCVEATCIFGSDTDAGAIARRQQLFDALDTIHSPNFFLSIDVKQTGQHAMRTGRLQRELEQWLAGLDPDKVETMLVDDPRGERFDWDELGGNSPSARSQYGRRPEDDRTTGCWACSDPVKPVGETTPELFGTQFAQKDVHMGCLTCPWSSL